MLEGRLRGEYARSGTRLLGGPNRYYSGGIRSSGGTWLSGCGFAGLPDGVGHRTKCAFGKALGLAAEGVIEARAVVLPGDCGGQFHQLAIFETRAQSCEQIRGHFHRRNGHGDSMAQHQLFDLGELRAGFKLREAHQLGFGDARLSADGRSDVDSKRAADQSGGLYARECFEHRRDGVHPLLRQFHAARGGQQARLMRGDA